MAGYRKELGQRAEQIARDELVRRGRKIVEANYRSPPGEIDLVVRDRGTLVFVEVRSNTSDQLGSPQESITAAKRKRMIATARHYLQAHGADDSHWRIDVVAVEFGPAGARPKVEVIEDAVSE